MRVRVSRGIPRAMHHLGIDEAGLGPTLGPLCWGACRWEHAHSDDAELWSSLAPLVARPPTRATLRLGDSKRIFSGVKRLAKLEIEVLTWVGWAMGKIPTSFRLLWTHLHGPAGPRCSWTQCPQPQWLQEAFELSLPLRCEVGELETRIAALDKHAQVIGLGSPHLGARVLCAPGFNHEMLRLRNEGLSKNNLAIEHALALAQRMQNTHEPPIESVVFDKMGSRNSYAQLIGGLNPSGAIRTIGETREQSDYEFSSPTSPTLRCRFVARSESQFPSVALAACIAKYMREVVIVAFQAHFRSRYPMVKATAGYPQDAQRFLQELKAHNAPELLSPAQSTWIRRA